MNIGIMGGTFDPIHIGHLIAAEKAREAARLDEIWFMPSFIPPHKPNTPAASALHRLAMVRLAVEGYSKFIVSELEIDKGGTSYTIDTVKELLESYTAYRFSWIIGADMVQYLPQWHHIEELVELISFIGLYRPGFEIDENRLTQRIKERVSFVSMPLVDISSTDIRSGFRDGHSNQFLLPDKVLAYIKENRLYES